MNRFKKTMYASILGLSCVVGLTGCFEVAVGTTVYGTLVATDRRTLGAQTEDKAILLKGGSLIAKVAGSDAHVNITSFNRKVLLTGEVPNETVKKNVEREINTIEGVVSVANELVVLGSSSFTGRSSDTIITGKVKAAFVDAKDLYANTMKVVTERGVVYLMGRVTQREGDIAAKVASGVGGVQKVVKLFEYITEEELKTLTKTNAAPAPVEERK